MNYLQAVSLAHAELMAGHIKAYCTGYTADRGRYIEMQTDQGWNPEPFFQEIQPEHYSGANDGADLYL